MEAENNSKTTETLLKEIIYGHGRGWCFTPSDFLHLNRKNISEDAIYKSLQRLCESGFIRRLTHGIYDYPKKHAKLGLLPPNYEKIAAALTRRHKIKFQPSGAYAANILGFTEQVPAKVVFLTDGPDKKIKIGNSEIIFRHTTAKNMSLVKTKMGLIIQGLKNIGRKFISNKIKKKLSAHLSSIDAKEFQKAYLIMPAWMKQLTKELRGEWV